MLIKKTSPIKFYFYHPPPALLELVSSLPTFLPPGQIVPVCQIVIFPWGTLLLKIVITCTKIYPKVAYPSSYIAVASITFYLRARAYNFYLRTARVGLNLAQKSLNSAHFFAQNGCLTIITLLRGPPIIIWSHVLCQVHHPFNLKKNPIWFPLKGGRSTTNKQTDVSSREFIQQPHQHPHLSLFHPADMMWHQEQSPSPDPPCSFSSSSDYSGWF